MLKEKRMTHQERSEISDKKMLAATVELILEKGTEKTTLKEVGEKAGYSRGLAGYRFGSKSGLFAFSLRKLGTYWLHYLTEATEGKVGLDAIYAATDVHYKVLEEDYDYVRVFYIFWFEGLRDNAELKDVVMNMNKRRHEDLVGWISGDSGLKLMNSTAEDIASHYNCVMNGIVYQYLHDPKDSSELKRLHNNLNRTMDVLLKD
jgi:AcrR family transcriptional regulator